MDIVLVAEELQSLLSSGTRVPGFRRKVLVDIDRLVELGQELQNSMPAEIREAQEVLNQKESILNQARLEALRIKGAADERASVVIEEAQREHASMVEESEIVKDAKARGQEIENDAMVRAQQQVQDAQKKAYQIVGDAESMASSLREGANLYANEVLFNLEEQLAGALGQVRRGIDTLGLEAKARQVDNSVPA